MPIPSDIHLGPLSQRMCLGASWQNQDEFPGNQVWADELESVLKCLEAHGQFQRFLPRLRGKLTQRNGALAEARVAFFLCCNGFLITCWEPQGGANSLGEFKIKYRQSPSIFVEVKAPTWEGQLSHVERLGVRRQAEKYMHAEIRSLNTLGKIVETINKSKVQNKFAISNFNLLIVYASYLFISPRELSMRIVVPTVQSAINTIPALGAVLIFDVICENYKIIYSVLFIENSMQRYNSKLPDAAVRKFTALNVKDFTEKRIENSIGK